MSSLIERRDRSADAPVIVVWDLNIVLLPLGAQDIVARLRPHRACDLLNAPATAPLAEAARGPLFSTFAVGFMHGASIPNMSRAILRCFDWYAWCASVLCGQRQCLSQCNASLSRQHIPSNFTFTSAMLCRLCAAAHAGPTSSANSNTSQAQRCRRQADPGCQARQRQIQEAERPQAKSAGEVHTPD